MKPHPHQALIKAWADGAEIEYMHRTRHEWMPVASPNWGVDQSYRVKPNECSASIKEGVITLEDGTEVDLKWIQGLLNEAYGAHGHQDFATAANQMAKLTGMTQGPHEEWYVTTEGDRTCPECGRTLEDPSELETGLCSSDDCPRHDTPTEESK